MDRYSSLTELFIIPAEKQRAFLEGIGCHAMQGYLFSPPIPADEMELLLKRGAPGVEWLHRIAGAC